MNISTRVEERTFAGFRNVKVPKGQDFLLDQTANSLQHYDGPLNLVIDIGACIGGFTLAALANGARFVVAVEPDVDNFALLYENVRNAHALDKVLLVNAAVVSNAVFEQHTFVHLYKGPNDGQRSISIDYSEVGSVDAYSVQTTTLSRLLYPYNRQGADVDYLKIDIEGGEHDLFDNADKYTLGNVGYVNIELHPLSFNETPEEVARMQKLREQLEFLGVEDVSEKPHYGVWSYVNHRKGLV